MTAANNIFQRSDTGFDESLVHVFTELVRGSRRRAIERKVTTLRADDEFLARDAVLGCEYLQRPANGSLASLKTIVSGSVDDIDAKLHCSDDSIRVVRVGRFVCVAEIGADADG